MAKASFSGRAKADLLSIGEHTLRNWGDAQTVRYLDGLEQDAKLLARNPGIGRSCDWIRPGLRRFEQGWHIMFYRQAKGGILVVRILHQSMLPDTQVFEDESPGG